MIIRRGGAHGHEIRGPDYAGNRDGQGLDEAGWTREEGQV